MSKPLITIFGATGAQGGGLARALLDDGPRDFRVRAVTRQPGSDAARALSERGAEIFAADLDDPASVERAMRGAYGAFCVTNFWAHFSAERELAQADTLAEAARRAGVRHVIWSTLEDTRRFVEPDGSSLPVLQQHYNVPHFDAKGEADALFIGRGLPLTRLLTSFYWDNLIHFGMQPQRDANGQLGFVLPMGDAALPGIAAADIGPCAAALFRRGEAAIGRSIGIAGEHLTGAQMADALARALGEPVRHVALSREAYAALGFPGADDLANMFRFKQDFEAEFRAARDVAASRALHPGLMDFETWLRANAARIPVAPRIAA
ncbi:NmrA/HSCARG family protein [uncultured Piscinibacter sp.]|uniref:NmrA/HSCARG family protein n=1 Tax=uncultured Piscinibacter sp. TaxID=1131835 RepID=UPI002621A3EE|nr:NmrA/HSCARG family protein [uncultured Piscinibacter sp.]